MGSSCFSPIWLICSSTFPKSSSVALALFLSLQNLAILLTSSLFLLKTFPYHRTPFALAIRTSSTHSKFVISWLLLFSISLCPRIALIIAFSLFSFFSQNCHFSFPKIPRFAPVQHRRPYTTEKSYLSSSVKVFFHEATPHFLNIHRIFVLAITAASLPSLALNLCPKSQNTFINSTWSTNDNKFFC